MCSSQIQKYTVLENQPAFRLMGIAHSIEFRLWFLTVKEPGIEVAYGLESGDIFAIFRGLFTFLGIIKPPKDVYISNEYMGGSMTADVWNLFRANIAVHALINVPPPTDMMLTSKGPYQCSE